MTKTSLREQIEIALSSYAKAKTEPFAKHPFQHSFKTELAGKLEADLALDDRYIVKASVGMMGSWTHCPWIAILDTLVTSTPQRGYYPVLAFRSDMTGFYLSLNQGVTDLTKSYGAKAKSILFARAATYASRLGKVPNDFLSGRISLGAPSGTQPSYYDHGNIWGKFYPSTAIPTDDELINDIRRVLQAYSALVDFDSSETEPLPESEGSEEDIYEEGRRWTFHRRVERNRRLSDRAKEIHGSICAACEFQFEDAYGELGRDYIEAHHLIPIAMINGPVSLNAKSDFICLCANCHRMIHRLSKNENPLSELRRIIFSRKAGP